MPQPPPLPRESTSTPRGILEERALAARGARGSTGEKQLEPRSLAGRLCELCGEHAGATLTQACALVRRAQACGQRVVWIGTRGSSFFPPDLADAGIDLDALAVVRLPERAAPAAPAAPAHTERGREHGGRGARDLAQAADLLVRSGAFDLVVVDLAASRARLSLAALTRLSGLARAHACAIVFLTRKPPEEPSLGSLISLRADVRRRRAREEPEHFPGLPIECVLEVTKDRLHPRGWSRSEPCDGPPGLR